MLDIAKQNWVCKIHSWSPTDYCQLSGNNFSFVGLSLRMILNLGKIVSFAPSLGMPLGFPGGAVVKNLPANTGDARDAGSTPGSGRSPGARMTTCSSIFCLENSQTEEPGGPIVHRVIKSRTRLSMHALGSMRSFNTSRNIYCCLSWNLTRYLEGYIFLSNSVIGSWQLTFRSW